MLPGFFWASALKRSVPGAVLLVVVIAVVVITAEVITEEVITVITVITEEVPTSILADTSGFPSTRILMAITHSTTIRTVTPILIPMHIRAIPTPMISQQYTVNRNSPITGITAGIRKGITRT